MQAACECMGTIGAVGGSKQGLLLFLPTKGKVSPATAPGPRGQRVSSTQRSQELLSEPGWVARAFCLVWPVLHFQTLSPP